MCWIRPFLWDFPFVYKSIRSLAHAIAEMHKGNASHLQASRLRPLTSIITRRPRSSPWVADPICESKSACNAPEFCEPSATSSECRNIRWRTLSKISFPPSPVPLGEEIFEHRCSVREYEKGSIQWIGLGSPVRRDVEYYQEASQAGAGQRIFRSKRKREL